MLRGDLQMMQIFRKEIYKPQSNHSSRSHVSMTLSRLRRSTTSRHAGFQPCPSNKPSPLDSYHCSESDVYHPSLPSPAQLPNLEFLTSAAWPLLPLQMPPLCLVPKCQKHLSQTPCQLSVWPSWPEPNAVSSSQPVSHS